MTEEQICTKCDALAKHYSEAIARAEKAESKMWELARALFDVLPLVQDVSDPLSQARVAAVRDMIDARGKIVSTEVPKATGVRSILICPERVGNENGDGDDAHL